MAKLKIPRQEQLCQEYLIDLNQTQAAIRAGYSSKSVHASASRLFAKPAVRARVNELLARRSARTGVNAERVVRELARVAFASALNVIDPDTATILPTASEDDRAIVQSVRVKTFPTKEGEGVEREVRVTDKLKALELLGKHLGMFTDRLVLSEERPQIVDDIPGGGGDG